MIWYDWFTYMTYIVIQLYNHILTVHSHEISINIYMLYIYIYLAYRSASSDPQAHRAAEMAVDRASELDDRRLEVQMPKGVSLREQKTVDSCWSVYVMLYFYILV